MTIVLEHPEVSPDGRPTDRVWAVRLRRREHVVTIAEDLGWPSATALANALEAVLYPRREEGGAGA